VTLGRDLAQGVAAARVIGRPAQKAGAAANHKRAANRAADLAPTIEAMPLEGPQFDSCSQPWSLLLGNGILGLEVGKRGADVRPDFPAAKMGIG
jgi:hypothetical protein